MIDEIDRKLINALEKDGRATYADLANELGVGVSTVARRIERLQKNNMLKIVGVPNIEKLGYKAHAIISLDVELTKIDGVCNKLIGNPNIHFVAVLYGRFDIILFVHFPTQEELHNFVIKELSAIDGVLNIETFFIAEMKKRYGGPFPKD